MCDTSQPCASHFPSLISSLTSYDIQSQHNHFFTLATNLRFEPNTQHPFLFSEMDVAGLESLAGGRTGDHPYSGPDGEKRFAKMKENVVREWEEEQRKFGTRFLQ